MSLANKVILSLALTLVISAALLTTLTTSASAYLPNVNFHFYPGESRWGSTTRISWDQVYGASDIELQLSGNADFSNSDYTYYDGDTTWVDIINLTQNDKPLYIKVTAYDQAMEYSSTSSWIYTHSSYPPPSPTLESPLDGSIVSGSRVDFYYSIPEYANDMEFIRATDPDFTNISYDSGWTGYTHTHTWTTGLKDDGRTYYWKVRAKNWTGEGPYSDTYSFKNGNQLPDVPIPNYPVNDIASGKVVDFYWEDSLRADDYYLEIARDQNFVYISCYGPAQNGAYCTNFRDDGQPYWWRVKARNFNGDSAFSPVSTFQNGDQLPDVPNLISPADGAIVPGTTIDFTWQESAHTNIYEIEVSTDNNFSDLVCSGGAWDIVGTGDIPCSSFLDDGQSYYWRVRAKNYIGSSVSQPKWFINGNRKPDVPVLVYPGPQDNASGSNVTFTWTPAQRTVSYQLQVAKDINFIQKVVNVPVEGANSYTAPNFLDDGKTYFWRVIASNYVGDTNSSPWPWSFVNGPSAPPAKPGLINPPDGVNKPGDSVLLQWSGAARAYDYHLQVATDPGFPSSSLIYDQWMTDQYYQYVNPHDNGKIYYWRVEARNSRGSTFSDTRSFINGPSTPPDQPSWLQPPDGSLVPGSFVTLQWGQDYYDRADDYLLQVSTDPGFANFYFNQWVGKVYQHTLNINNDNTTYYWRVAAKNAAGTSPFSTTLSFLNVSNSAPDKPTLVSPSEGAHVPGDRVFFQWSDTAGPEDNYHLQVATDLDFNHIVLDTWPYYNVGSGPGFKNDGTTYYWRVEVWNPYASTYSDVGSFINGPPPPPVAPVLLAPGDGNKVLGTNVLLEWSDVAEATYYQLQVATDSSFANKVFDQSVEADTRVVILGDDGETYYWRVASGTQESGLGEFSMARSFINGPTAPDTPPTLFSPVSGEKAGGELITFLWSGVTNANDYLLQISSDPNFTSMHFNEWLGNTAIFAVDGFPDNGGQYYWRVAARNTSHVDMITAFQTPGSFVNGPSGVHDSPRLTSPLIGSNVAGTGINFTWESVPRARTYRIEVALDDTFTTLIGGAQNVSTTNAYLEGFDNVGHVYYWRVAGVNEYGTGPYSATSSFTNGTLQISTGANEGQTLNLCTASSTNAATGSIAHDQELFSTKGVPLATAIELYYNSLPPYNGPLGPGWSHSYDITLTANADGSVLYRDGSGGRSFYYQSGTGYISSLGDTSTLVKNGDGSYVITYRDGRRYNFNQSGKITSIVDRFNNTISFAYTGSDLTSITDPAQRVTTISYDQTTTPHRITTITDPNQKIYDFAYQGNSLWRVTNPAADPINNPVRGYWEYLYDAQGYLQSKTDPNGNKYQYTYYADHRMETAIDPEGIPNPTGHTRTFVYPTNTDNLRTTTFTEKDGGVWLFTYDIQAGVLKQKTDPNGKVTSYTYYTDGYLKSKTEPKDGSTRLTTFYSYDNYGNLLTQTEPADLSVYTPVIDPAMVSDPATLSSLSPPINAAFSYSYDTNNYDRITSVSDLRGTAPLTTTFAYTTENGGEMVTVTAPGNIVTVIKKYPSGTVKEIINANQEQTNLIYYPDTPGNRSAGIVGLLQTITGPDGITTIINSYDKNGNPQNIQLKDAAGNGKLTTVQQFDALNRLQKLTKITATLPDNVTQYGYDQMGNMNSLTDAETHSTTYVYNFNRQVTKITDTLLNDTVFTYSGSGCTSCGSGVNQLTGVFDPNVAKKTPLDSQPHTAYSYDSLGRLQYETDPLGKKIHYTYYDNGLLKEKYDATGTPETLLVTHTYNNRGQITDKIFTDGTAEHYTYYPDGKLQTAANQNISYSYVYYDNGRLHTVTDTTNNRTISYDQYDGLGQRKQVTILPGTADQRVIGYDYDSANRPWHVTNGDKTFTFGYDDLGRRNALTYPNQTVATYGYDDLNRLTGITHRVVNGGPVVAGITYPTYDQVGNRKAKTATEAETYQYDNIYRLLTVISSKPETFVYDAVGNRQNGPSPKDTGYQHDAANRMTGGRKLGYTYDNFGNQTARTMTGVTDKTWTQTWDYSNRLVKVEKVNGTNKRTVTFKYDPFGRRIEKRMDLTIDGVTQTTIYNYFYDNEDIVYETMTDGSGTTVTHYVHGPGIDEPLALERNNQFYYYHADGLGSVVAISDSTQNVVQRYTYDSYGMVKPATTFANSYTYTGREWDKETGLYCYRNRYRDPIDGTFISKDPISIAGGDVNLFRYTENNPLNFVDSQGLASTSDKISWAVSGADLVKNMVLLPKNATEATLSAVSIVTDKASIVLGFANDSKFKSKLGLGLSAIGVATAIAGDSVILAGGSGYVLGRSINEYEINGKKVEKIISDNITDKIFNFFNKKASCDTKAGK